MYVTNSTSRTQIPNQSPTSTVTSMSYAGPASRTHGSAGRRDPAASAPARPIGPSSPASLRRTSAPPADSDEGEHETDWQRVAIFGVGLAIGLTLGAGAALL